MRELIASVGAGRMGRGIAITFAMAGHKVHLIDVKTRTPSEFSTLRKEACAEIAATLSMLSELGLIRRVDVDVVAMRISYAALGGAQAALAGADVIFEAVPETIDAKEAAFAWISKYSKKDAIVASTTSTILSNDLQPFVQPASRFVNAHWLNPAFLVPLVEVSPGDLTDPAVTECLRKLLERIGKVPIVCEATPGYIVPRIQALAMNEAARMIEQGVASAEDIDKATRYGFGFRFAVLGLLEFIDWGGGDILYYASRYLSEALNSDRYAAPAIIERHMKEDRIGLKTRQGFLDYTGMNIPEYQQNKLSEFVALLRHIGKLPVVVSDVVDVESTGDVKASVLVRRYLDAMERREIDQAKTCLAGHFQMTFPGNVHFDSLSAMVEWSKTRYQYVTKQYQRFDESCSGNDTVVYCFGTLQGVWLDGTEFSDIRFIDRFVVSDGQIVLQQVWNDLAENNGAVTAVNTTN